MRVFSLLMALLLAASAWASEASKLYKKGRKEEKAGHIAKAYLLYSQAAALEPKHRAYWARAEALQSRAAEESQVTPRFAIASLDPADAAAPTPIDEATKQDWDDAKKPLPPSHLTADPARKSFNLNTDSKKLFEAVARAYGLDCVFDGDYQAGKPIRFTMADVDYHEALHALEAVTDSFIVPVSGKLFMVIKDTAQKRKEEEPFGAIIVPLPEPTTTQDLTAMITAVQQASGIQKVAWDSQKNVVIMKDSVSKVLPAQELFKQLLYRRGQVLFDLDVVEVSRSNMTNLGLTLPNTFPVYSFSDFAHSVPTIASNAAGLLAFGGGESLLGFGIASASLVATLSKSDSKTLLHATARSLDGLPATIHVGQKYPILTSGFFGPASFTPNGAASFTPPPSFTFEDLGLSVKATPHIHGAEEVTLTVETEFKVLAGTALNGVPVISNRSLKCEARFKFGEWAVVGGLMDDEDAHTMAGIWGLAQVPLLGPLTRNSTRNKKTDEILIMIRPSLVDIPPDNDVTHVLRMGSESKPLSPL